MKKGFGVVILFISLAMIGLGIYFHVQDKEFTVKFIGASNIADITVKEGSYIKRPTDPTKEGYKFVGWYYNSSLFDFNTKVEKDLILEAKWEKVSTSQEEPDNYTVDFQDEQGNSIKKVVLEKGNVVEKPIDPTKEGYKFVGWFREDKIYDFNREVTSDLILVSRFEKINSYIVTFNSDGGSNISSLTVEEGKVVTKPKDPTKSGYTFLSWQLNGKNYDFNSKVTSNITLKATWKKNVVKYTVKFDSVGGNSINSQTVIEGDKVTKPKNPTRVGYTFLAWQLNGKNYDFNSKVTSNITLKATWKANASYTVTFDSDGGSSISSKTIVGGTKVSKPDDPTKNGYLFKGWQLNGNFYDFNTIVTSNITLKAVWEIEK